MDDEKRKARNASTNASHARLTKVMTLRIPNDDMDLLEEAAAEAGMSRTAYIMLAVRNQYARDKRRRERW